MIARELVKIQSENASIEVDYNRFRDLLTTTIEFLSGWGTTDEHGEIQEIAGGILTKLYPEVNEDA